MNYFDHNATSPLTPRARAAWLEASERFIGNPSSPHRVGARAEAALNDARLQLAGFLGCDPLDLIWTSGATEAVNTVLHHFARSLSSDSEIWVSAIEHPCVLQAARFYFPNRLRLIPVLRTGVIDLDWIAAELRSKPPGLVAVMAANNETGVLQPWREMVALCREFEAPFFCDATQWVGKVPAADLGQCDWTCGSGHKFGGPRGVGFLKCPGRLEPLLRGGQQEEGRRAGTENVPSVLSMAAALEERESALSRGEEGLRLAWRTKFESRLQESLPGLAIVGNGQSRLWNTVLAIMPDADCRQRWVVKLDKEGFAVSTGSACASGREEPSHVVTAMGYTPAEASRVLRFSSGWHTSESDWWTLAAAIEDVHRRMFNTA